MVELFWPPRIAPMWLAWPQVSRFYPVRGEPVKITLTSKYRHPAAAALPNACPDKTRIWLENPRV